MAKLPCQFCGKSASFSNNLSMYRCKSCGTVTCVNCSGKISVLRILIILIPTFFIFLVYIKNPDIVYSKDKFESLIGGWIMFQIGFWAFIGGLFGFRRKSKCMKCNSDTLIKI